MRRILRKYEAAIRANIAEPIESDDHNLRYWQDRLFFNFLLYCLPVSLIALLPGVFMAVKDGFPVIAVVDLVSFGLIICVTFLPGIALRNRKIVVIIVFYILAVFLINSLGYIGPGVFYLFFITIIAALIFPIRYAYWSILCNACLLLVFALIIAFKLFHTPLSKQYNTGEWIAFSANLVFASIVIVLLIDQIFQGLQLTITTKTQLQQRYLKIFDSSPLPMWLFDTDTFKFLDVNQAAVKNYGYSKAEFMAMTIMDIRRSETVQQTAELVRANRLSGRYYSGVSQHIKKNGEIIYVNVESNLLNLDGSKVRLVQATDITNQIEHQLEAFEANVKLKESESNLRALFDSAVDGFVLLDDHFIIKLFNPRASASMQFNKDQIPFEVGRSIFDYVQTSRLPYFQKIIDKVYKGETVDYDRVFRTNGMISWIRYTLSPVHDEQRIVGASITGRDVTVRKLYLRSVEEQNKTFREISWLQSHMVRAPVARILGLLPMLPDAADEQERAELINYLQMSATELDQTIREITKKTERIVEKYSESGSN